jgi:hypothetical protein
MMTNLFSVCAFFAALLLFSCQNMRRSIRVSVGLAAGIVAVLIFWCIVNSWDSGDGHSENDDLIDYKNGQNTT